MLLGYDFDFILSWPWQQPKIGNKMRHRMDSIKASKLFANIRK